jgi:hypothetical protein
MRSPSMRAGISGPALEDETPVAIAALDIAPLINFKPDARMAKCGPAGNIAGTIARDPMAGDDKGVCGYSHAGVAISNG